jgi:predicted dienelactone hydrolase
VTDLLVDPVHAMAVHSTIPDDSTLYGPYAGATFPYVQLVCYPTVSANTRAGYVLPSGNVVPHMQRGAEQPMFENASARYPVILYSHGLSGSPIDGDYVESVKQVASGGCVVTALFHGDLRFAEIDLDSFADAIYALLHYKTFVAMQAVHPLSLSAALDVVLGHLDFRDHVDPDSVGAFGASLGGESAFMMAGAALTTSLGQSSSRALFDPRLKAAVGYIPYFGADSCPAFGRDLKGLDGVALPYLAIAGTADTAARLNVIERGVRRLAGTRQLVALADLEPGYDSRYADDLTTWMFAFLAGQLSGDAAARATSARMTSVAAGRISRGIGGAPFLRHSDGRT